MELESHRGEITERTTLQANINYNRAEAMWAVTEAVAALTRSIETTPSDYREWFLKYDYFDAFIHTAYTYYHEGDFEGLNTFLTEVPQLWEMTPENYTDLQNFTTFMNMLEQQITGEGTEYTLEAIDLNTLYNFALGDTPVAGIIRSFLEVRYGYQFTEGQQGRLNVKNNQSENKAGREIFSSSVAVYPNPSDKEFNFVIPSDYKGENLKIVIYDFTGKQIGQLHLDSETKNTVWSGENHLPGIYFYSIHNSKNVLKSGRLSLIK